jgi:hypothetical protein
VFLNGDADWKRDPKTHLFVLNEKQKTQLRDTNDWVRFAERISKDTHLPGIYLARPGLAMPPKKRCGGEPVSSRCRQTQC